MKYIKNLIKEYWILAATVALALFIMCGCSCQKQIIKEVEVEKYIHDTTIERVHDTVNHELVVHDSIDRYVRDSAWVDSLGHIYHYRLERYVQISRESEQMYKTLEEENIRLRDSLDRKVDVEIQTVVKEKKVLVKWPLWLLGIAAAAACKYRSSIITFIKKLIERWKSL